MALVRLVSVSKTYDPDAVGGGVEAVQDISLDICDGEFLSIIGPTGCGKSTILEMIAGLKTPTSGTIHINGEEVTEPREGVTVVFQDDSTLPWRTVMENVEFGLEMEGMDKVTRRERASEIIDLVGLTGFEDSYPNELSGGMRQRVAIGRALAMDPDILLMDEPFGALDEQTRLILGEELLRIWRETDKTVVFITHSLTEAVHLSDRVLAMTARPGQIKQLLEVDLPRPREADVVTTDQFNLYTDKLWESLREEAKSGLESPTAD